MLVINLISVAIWLHLQFLLIMLFCEVNSDSHAIADFYTRSVLYFLNGPSDIPIMPLSR
uniref:Uncharacterized protein n=1 Tax=Setaria viridis TaxID=4556 RepID=A0A4U6V0T3_SETVI|nr:hypothetical protein SEVIR_4G074501v2 [Setaria viridis]